MEQSLKSLYFDIAGNAFPRGLKILSTMADEDHIVFGGDFPYTPVEMLVNKCQDFKNNVTGKTFDKIAYLNAEKLFSLT